MFLRVIFGEGHGAEADVWSLGITLYELLAGGTPFASQSAAGGRTSASETFQERIHKVDYVLPNWFSSEVCHLVNGMLQRYPQQRYTASKVLEHKWLARFFLKPKQAGARPPSLEPIPEPSPVPTQMWPVSAAVPPHAGLPKSLSRPELGIHPGACRTHAHYEIRAAPCPGRQPSPIAEGHRRPQAHFAQRSGGAVGSGRSPYPAHAAGITIAAGRRAGLRWLLGFSAIGRPRTFSDASSGFADPCRPAGAQGGGAARDARTYEDAGRPEEAAAQSSSRLLVACSPICAAG
eukprot:s2427_g11.t1